MNYAELKQAVGILVADTSTTFFTPAETAQAIQLACNHIAAETGVLRDVVTFNTVTDQGAYTLPTTFRNFAGGVDLYDGSVSTPLSFRSVERLRQDDADWESSSGVPDTYSFENSVLYLYPVPNGIYRVRLDYVPAPNIMVADTDQPLYGALRAVPYHDTIVMRAAWWLTFKDRDFDAADRLNAEFQRRLIDMKEALRNVGDTRAAKWGDPYGMANQ